MHRLRTGVVVLAVLLSLASSSAAQNDENRVPEPIGDEGFEVMRQFFEYDTNVLLDARVVGRDEVLGHGREKFVFSGMRRGRVPGYLALPENTTEPVPCILLIHGLNAAQEDWWEEGSTFGSLTRALLDSGYAVLTLDAVYHGERAFENDFESPRSLIQRQWFVHARDMIVGTVIDYRRAMDYLATRSEIDVDRVGVIGYSMGGIMAFNLTAIDARVRAAVSCVSPVITAPYLPSAVHNFAPRIQAPFLMLMATNDEQNYTSESATRIYDLVGSASKDLVFYDSGHMLPREWTTRAADWLRQFID